MNQAYPLKELLAQLHQKILTLGTADASEAEVMATWLLEYYLLIDRTDLLVNNTVEVSDVVAQRLSRAVARVQRQEPIQYILEEAYFYGRRFKVTPDVLVPRRETEELVAMVKDENPQEGLRILDVGTGSGCIAVTLSKEMRKPTVHALDISPLAVRVAEENAAMHQADVTFSVRDILQKEAAISTPYDIIVSNPPYVRRSEAGEMTERVLKYEPEQALFVEDHQPLLYYKRMVELSRSHGWLSANGKIYWEINEALGDEILFLLAKNQFVDVRLQKDMQGKSRFVRGKLAEEGANY